MTEGRGDPPRNFTETQQRRVRMRARNLSLRAIAEIEGVSIEAVRMSIQRAERKLSLLTAVLYHYRRRKNR